MSPAPRRGRVRALPKTPTGIVGLDEITAGGLPRGRPTLVCGGPGCGKTLLAMEFVVRGAMQFGEPGVFVTFEEKADELEANVRSLGFDLDRLVAQKKLVVDHVFVERSEIEETGVYDLEGLFIRIGYAIDRIGAKRVALDTIEVLFAGLLDHTVVRAELRRLFRWLKDRGVTAVITAERGGTMMTRHGMEEYVSDCVLLLDHRVTDQVATRRLRIVKYRGSTHGPNEYPFLIDEGGISLWAISSMRLEHAAPSSRISSGVAALDQMLGKGFYRGSTVLISGTAGTGKTSLASAFADGTCRRGERCLYFAFEESPAQVCRNMRSIGIDLQHWLDVGLLHYVAVRPSYWGLEMHVVQMVRAITEFKPHAVVIDPISSLEFGTPLGDLKAALLRIVDLLKTRGITAILTSLTSGGGDLEQTDVGLSSLVDTWIVLRDYETRGERNRLVHILKSRGSAHSNQLREFTLSARGFQLADPYVGPEGLLTGTARLAQASRDADERVSRTARLERERLASEIRRRALEGQIAALQAGLASEQQQFDLLVAGETERHEREVHAAEAIARGRHSDTPVPASRRDSAPRGARR
ncbi:circadian clock protein KaiC [Luteitalea sp. TBR-22]|uniref:circadian clock protein KaiC n=1 Tax=Luteitalea sp. TBR-22 TaxID=2802971 RepID=UPI001AF21F4F|nr:circadian clock protein KaiC [Luteitalea sp. TBR-22]BCS34838.1 circadian clock protein KaiC [Luteitalea sp. TBR-22]